MYVCMYVCMYACMYVCVSRAQECCGVMLRNVVISVSCDRSDYEYVTGSEKTTLIAQLRKKIFLRGTENLTIFYRLQFVSGE